MRKGGGERGAVPGIGHRRSGSQPATHGGATLRGKGNVKL